MRAKPVVVRWLSSLALGMGLASAAWAGPYSQLFVFGDSLSDIGNDLSLPGGVPAPAYYTDGTHTGRFTNGLNYADDLAASLGVPLVASVNGGTDYAYGGALTASSPLPGSLSFNAQVQSYTSANAADPNALYVLWIGANDMSAAIEARALGNVNAIPQAIGVAMSGIAGAITSLESRGATHFLIPNLPDLSLVPEINSLNNATLSFIANSASVAFNSSLDTTLSQFSGADIHKLDVFSDLNDIVAHPSAFGLTNIKNACYSGGVDGSANGGPATPTVCATPGSYLFWDYEHPTAAVHAIVAADALAAVTPVPEPETLALMLAGLAVVGVAGRRRLS